MTDTKEYLLRSCFPSVYGRFTASVRCEEGKYDSRRVLSMLVQVYNAADNINHTL
jgi:hypothetical protein